jgi:predicted cobalt transporter CbtA
MRFAHLLRRGLAAGLAAGLASAVLIWLVVEPVIRRALAIEEARGAGHRGHAEEPLVSRGLQVAGGAVTVVVVGTLFGVVFAVVFAKVRHRLPGNSDFTRSAVLTALGFFVFVLMPALKIPANPPAVGDPETVTERTLIYVLSILLSLGLVFAVAALNRYLHGIGAPDSTRYTLGMYAAVAGVVAILVLAPSSPDSVPSDVPASLLWDFRLASLAQLAAMWAVLGVTFGLLVDKGRRQKRGAAPATT